MANNKISTVLGANVTDGASTVARFKIGTKAFGSDGKFMIYWSSKR